MRKFYRIKIIFNSAKVIANDYATESLKKHPDQYAGKSVCGDTLATYPDMEKEGLAAFHKDVSPRNTTDFFYFSNLSNMLHAMLDCRPVAANREIYNGVPSRGKRLELIDDIAKRGFYKITNEPYVEFTQGKKPYKNAHVQSLTTVDRETNITIKGHITWESLKKKAKISPNYARVYDTFIEWAKRESIDNPEKDFSIISFMTFIKDKVNHEEIEKLPITDFRMFLSGLPCSFSSLTANKGFSYIPRTLNTAPTPKVSLNGEILLFVTEEELSLFKNAKGVATLLDGGVATMEPAEKWEKFEEEYMDEPIDKARDEGFKPIDELPRFNGDN